MDFVQNPHRIIRYYLRIICFTWADHNTLLFGQLGAEVNIVVDAIEI
jgi:hypothetical protein